MTPSTSLEVAVGGTDLSDDDAATPLVLLHGFTQTARTFGPFGDALASSRRMVTVDLPGHGGSSEVRTGDLWDAAARVVAAVDEAPGLGGAPFDLFGYSLGGRVALHVALAEPARVARLVLLSTTAGIDDPEALARRRATDETTADELEREGDVAAFMTRWLAQPMFAGLAGDDAQLAERRRNTAAGLASSLRSMGTGTQEPLWDRLGALEVPTLVVTGAADVRFTRIGVRLRDTLPHAALATIAGAGHAAHLEQPAVAARIVGHWLDTVAPVATVGG